MKNKKIVEICEEEQRVVYSKKSRIQNFPGEVIIGMKDIYQILKMEGTFREIHPLLQKKALGRIVIIGE